MSEEPNIQNNSSLENNFNLYNANLLSPAHKFALGLQYGCQSTEIHNTAFTLYRETEHRHIRNLSKI